MGSPLSKTSRLAVRSTSPTYKRRNSETYPHKCAVCNQRRSLNYHEQHPLAPGEIPPPGICRRCVKRNSSTPKTTDETDGIIKVHHYHHSCSCQSHTNDEKRELAYEIPNNIALPPLAELPAYDDAKDIPHTTRQLYPPPPPARTWRKPKLSNSDVVRKTLDDFEVGGLGCLTEGPVAGKACH